VEILEIFSRYRFRIGIGVNPIFKEQNVLDAITNAICRDENEKSQELILEENIEALKMKFKEKTALQ
jgi:hypothetical protein